MSRDAIKIQKGVKADLPSLIMGELGFCLDTKELFIGTDQGNVLPKTDINIPGVLGNNGYIKLPGGLIVQWGRLTIHSDGSGAGSGTITFPTPFPMAVTYIKPELLTFAPGSIYDGNVYARHGNMTTTTTDIHFNRCQANIDYTIVWLALGY